jgi:hypothetical protein
MKMIVLMGSKEGAIMSKALGDHLPGDLLLVIGD